MFPGCDGAAEMLKVLAAPAPHELEATTEIIPEPVKLLPKLTLMEVPKFLLMVTPEGTVHV